MKNKLFNEIKINNNIHDWRVIHPQAYKIYGNDKEECAEKSMYTGFYHHYCIIYHGEPDPEFGLRINRKEGIEIIYNESWLKKLVSSLKD